MSGSLNREPLALLTLAGCYFVRHGRHAIYFSPITNRNFPIPDNIKSRYTANAILGQAGLPKSF